MELIKIFLGILSCVVLAYAGLWIEYLIENWSFRKHLSLNMTVSVKVSGSFYTGKITVINHREKIVYIRRNSNRELIRARIKDVIQPLSDELEKYSLDPAK